MDELVLDFESHSAKSHPFGSIICGNHSLKQLSSAFILGRIGDEST
jgi:hypothetical protein